MSWEVVSQFIDWVVEGGEIPEFLRYSFGKTAEGGKLFHQKSLLPLVHH